MLSSLLALSIVSLACSSDPGSEEQPQGGSGQAGVSGQGGGAGKPGGGSAGQASAGSAGSQQGGGSGGSAGQGGSGGSAQGPGGAAGQGGSAGSAGEGQAGSAQAGSGGSSQAGSGGSEQAGQGGSEQAGEGGSAQAGGGQAGQEQGGQAGEGGSGQAGSEQGGQAGQAGGSGGSAGGSQGGAGGGESGWTDFTPTGTVYFVSDSDGDDNNNGGSDKTPFKTIKKGLSKLKDGAGDWLLLKRGDTFTGQTFEGFALSGKSEKEPLLVGTYGDPKADRPLLKTGTKSGVFIQNGNHKHLAFVGLHFWADQFNGTTGDAYGFWWFGPGENLLIEDCHFEGYGDNLAIQANEGQPKKNVVIRRSLIERAHRTDKGQGLYAIYNEGFVMEENIFYHNGWRTVRRDDDKSHNVYMNVHNEGVVFRGNISADAQSHGLQMRPGGLVEKNLFVRNALQLSFGLTFGGSDPKAGGVEGAVRDNVLLEATDISPALARGYGMQLANTKQGGSSIVEHNILAHDISEKPYGHAFHIDDDTDNDNITYSLQIRNNTVYGWQGAIFQVDATPGKTVFDVTFADNLLQSSFKPQLVSFVSGTTGQFVFDGNVYQSGADATKWFKLGSPYLDLAGWLKASGEKGAKAQQVKFKDPTRTVATYNGSLGKEATYDAWVAEVRKQRKGNWRAEYTAEGMRPYFIEGFTPLDAAGGAGAVAP